MVYVVSLILSFIITVMLFSTGAITIGDGSSESADRIAIIQSAEKSDDPVVRKEAEQARAKLIEVQENRAKREAEKERDLAIKEGRIEAVDNGFFQGGLLKIIIVCGFFISIFTIYIFSKKSKYM